MRPATKALALAAIALLPGGAFAAGNMPQLVPEDMPPQLVWLAILFAVLYGLMSTIAVPRIAATLQARDDKISGDLAEAEKANDNARAAIETYNQRLVAARESARGLTREREEADAAAASARLSQLSERIGAQIADAEKRIGEQRATALTGLEQMANEVAESVYAKLVGQSADSGALNAKVASAMKRSG
jgi:F-type H+-transporting ATPase subunit b